MTIDETTRRTWLYEKITKPSIMAKLRGGLSLKRLINITRFADSHLLKLGDRKRVVTGSSRVSPLLNVLYDCYLM